VAAGKTTKKTKYANRIVFFIFAYFAWFAVESVAADWMQRLQR
jgi:hypothetical protein